MPRLTYANVMSTLALFLALGGTSVAASNLISGSRIKQNSIPANRVKKGSLTAAQINVKALGTVPSATLATSAGTAERATSAGTADRATSAAAADRATSAAAADRATTAAGADHAASADHATDAATVGGQAPSAFMPSTRVLSGSVNMATATSEIYFTSPLGFQIETDGAAGNDSSIVIRNVRATGLGVLGAGVTILGAGNTRVVSVGASLIDVADDRQLAFIIQDPAAPSREALVECFLPLVGAGGAWAVHRHAQLLAVGDFLAKVSNTSR